jgi:hypothetical protein
LKCLPGEEEDTAGAGAADFEEEEVFSMPRFDGTGPMGAGPMTGGSRGYCDPAGTAYGPWCGGAYGYGRGLGRGRGRGLRRGFGPGFGVGLGYGRGFRGRAFYPSWGAGYAPAYGASYVMNPQDEAGMLKDEAEYMKRELDAILKRLEELEAKSQPA